MSKWLPTFLLLTTTSTLACGPAESALSGGSYATRDSAGIRIVENRAPAREVAVTVAEAPDLVIGSGAAAAEYELFGVVGATRLADGGILLANAGTGELRWYSAGGVFVRRAGGMGDGPGEFRGLAGIFLLPGDSVAAYDLRTRRLSLFDAGGAFVRSVQLREPSIGIAPLARFRDGTFLLWNGGAFAISAEGPARLERLPLDLFRSAAGEPERIEPVLSAEGLELVVTSTGGVRPDGASQFGRTFRAFGRNTVVAGHPDFWIVADNDRPELQLRAPEGSLSHLVRWNPGSRAVTSGDVQAYLDAQLERRSDPAARQRYLDAWAQQPPPPATMPSFSDVRIDELGHAWVKDYVPETEEDPNRYQVFGRDGVWLGAVHAPRGSVILWIGEDRMITLQADEMGVETVAVYGVERP
jgi:hypothetical protein